MRQVPEPDAGCLSPPGDGSISLLSDDLRAGIILSPLYPANTFKYFLTHFWPDKPQPAGDSASFGEEYEIPTCRWSLVVKISVKLTSSLVHAGKNEREETPRRGTRRGDFSFIMWLFVINFLVFLGSQNGKNNVSTRIFLHTKLHFLSNQELSFASLDALKNKNGK